MATKLWRLPIYNVRRTKIATSFPNAEVHADGISLRP